MPIQVRCPCGQTITVGADVLGNVVRCAACGLKLAVARSPATTSAATALGDSSQATTGGAPPEDHTPTPGSGGKQDSEIGPLTRKHLAQLKTAFGLRRRVSAAAALFLVVFAVSVCAAAILLWAYFAIPSGVVDPFWHDSPALPLTIVGILLVGGLNGLGCRETLRWKIGGMDAAMIGLFLAAVAALVVPLVSGFVRADEPLGIVLWFAGVVLCAVLLFFTFYSRDALPALVHLPDWCQELLVLSDPSPQRRFRRLPSRKRQRLRAAALRTGPVPDFPLLRQQVEQLAATARIADRVRAAASTYRFVFWIVLIDWLLLACATGLAPESLDRMAGQAKSALRILLVSSAVHLGIAALNGLAYAGTKRRMFWVPVALGALSGGLAGLAALVAVGAFLSYHPEAQTIVFVALAVALFLALVCLLSFRAAAAIVSFHAQPEWCQQVITAVD